MTRVTGLVQAASTRLRWRGRLREASNSAWIVEKVLDFPETVPGTVLRQWLNRRQDESLPPRVRLLLRIGSDSDVVAWLTRGRGDGDAAIYRREWRFTPHRRGATPSARARAQ